MPDPDDLQPSERNLRIDPSTIPSKISGSD
jgi:hypothetical protein